MNLRSIISCGWIKKAGIPGLTFIYLILGIPGSVLVPFVGILLYEPSIRFTIEGFWIELHLASAFYLSIPLLLMVLIHYQSSGMEKWTGRKAWLATAGLSALYLVALGFSVWCFNAHVCRGGHMAHSPYPLWHSFLDVLWPALMYFVVYVAMRKRLAAAPLFAFLSTVIVIFRFFFGSGGGMFAMFFFPS